MIRVSARLNLRKYQAYLQEVVGKLADPGAVLDKSLGTMDKEVREYLKDQAAKYYTVGRDRLDKNLSGGKSQDGWTYEMRFKSPRAIGLIEFQHTPKGTFTNLTRPAVLTGRRKTEDAVHDLTGKFGFKDFTATVNEGNVHLMSRVEKNGRGLVTDYGPSEVQMLQEALKHQDVNDYAEERLRAAVEKAVERILK